RTARRQSIMSVSPPWAEVVMQFRLPVPFLLAACLLLLLAPPSGADPKVTIQIWQLPTRDVHSVEQQADLAILKQFLTDHPGIDVRGFQGVTAPGIGGDARDLLAMAGGVAPDVMYVNFRQSDSYISQGFLYPLDDCVKRWVGVDDIHQAPA